MPNRAQIIAIAYPSIHPTVCLSVCSSSFHGCFTFASCSSHTWLTASFVSKTCNSITTKVIRSNYNAALMSTSWMATHRLTSFITPPATVLRKTSSPALRALLSCRHMLRFTEILKVDVWLRTYDVCFLLIGYLINEVSNDYIMVGLWYHWLVAGSMFVRELLSTISICRVWHKHYCTQADVDRRTKYNQKCDRGLRVGRRRGGWLCWHRWLVMGECLTGKGSTVHTLYIYNNNNDNIKFRHISNIAYFWLLCFPPTRNCTSFNYHSI